VVDSLPVLREIRKMPRHYICNVIYTLLGITFSKWVDARCQQRNAEIAVEKDLNILLDANIAAAFHQSTAISRMYYLLVFKTLLAILFIFILF
jgi:hypothetical protein